MTVLVGKYQNVIVQLFLKNIYMQAYRWYGYSFKILQTTTTSKKQYQLVRKENEVDQQKPNLHC